MKTLKTVIAILFVTLTSCSKNDDDTAAQIIKPTTYTVSTFAGANAGSNNGTIENALFKKPQNVIFDATGNFFIADSGNHQIRKITPAGVVSTFAGSTQGFADGQGSAAKFTFPAGICIDISGNLYVSDISNGKIRKITIAGLVSTFAGSTDGFADGQGTSAQFNVPSAVTIDANNNVFVVDSRNHKIRKISPTGVVSTIAGNNEGFTDGQGIAAQFKEPYGIAVDGSGNVYVADSGNHKIRKISPTGLVTTIAGNTSGFADGQGIAAQFDFPWGICRDTFGNLYVADNGGNNKIRKISPSGLVTTIAGGNSGFADGIGTNARFSDPHGIAIDQNGVL